MNLIDQFSLIYSGSIRSTQRSSRRADKENLRKVFSDQLCWFPDYFGSCGTLIRNAPSSSNNYPIKFGVYTMHDKVDFEIGGFNFIPIYLKHSYVISIHIWFLSVYSDKHTRGAFGDDFMAVSQKLLG